MPDSVSLDSYGLINTVNADDQFWPMRLEISRFTSHDSLTESCVGKMILIRFLSIRFLSLIFSDEKESKVLSASRYDIRRRHEIYIQEY